MANVKLAGEILNIFPSEIYGNFEKRVMWLREVDVQYPNTYQLEFQQGFANELDRYVPGDFVDVDVDVRGRHWEKGGKEGVMNTLKCWKITKRTGGKPPSSVRPAGSTTRTVTPPPVQQTGDEDLPF